MCAFATTAAWTAAATRRSARAEDADGYAAARPGPYDSLVAGLGMLKVECESCKAPYQIDERRVPPSGLKMRCSKCGHSFLVHNSEGPAGPLAPPEPGALAEPRPALPVTGAAPRPAVTRNLKSTMVGVGGDGGFASQSPSPIAKAAPAVPLSTGMSTPAKVPGVSPSPAATPAGALASPAAPAAAGFGGAGGFGKKTMMGVAPGAGSPLSPERAASSSRFSLQAHGPGDVVAQGAGARRGTPGGLSGAPPGFAHPARAPRGFAAHAAACSAGGSGPACGFAPREGVVRCAPRRGFTALGFSGRARRARGDRPSGRLGGPPCGKARRPARRQTAGDRLQAAGSADRAVAGPVACPTVAPEAGGPGRCDRRRARLRPPGRRCRPAGRRPIQAGGSEAVASDLRARSARPNCGSPRAIAPARGPVRRFAGPRGPAGGPVAVRGRRGGPLCPALGGSRPSQARGRSAGRSSLGGRGQRRRDPERLAGHRRPRVRAWRGPPCHRGRAPAGRGPPDEPPGPGRLAARAGRPAGPPAGAPGVTPRAVRGQPAVARRHAPGPARQPAGPARQPPVSAGGGRGFGEIELPTFGDTFATAAVPPAAPSSAAARSSGSFGLFGEIDLPHESPPSSSSTPAAAPHADQADFSDLELDDKRRSVRPPSPQSMTPPVPRSDAPRSAGGMSFGEVDIGGGGGETASIGIDATHPAGVDSAREAPLGLAAASAPVRERGRLAQAAEPRKVSLVKALGTGVALLAVVAGAALQLTPVRRVRLCRDRRRPARGRVPPGDARRDHRQRQDGRVRHLRRREGRARRGLRDAGGESAGTGARGLRGVRRWRGPRALRGRHGPRLARAVAPRRPADRLAGAVQGRGAGGAGRGGRRG